MTTRTDVSFKTSDGVTLRGWHYLPQGVTGDAPIIVMVHGFSAVKEMLLDRFAEVFAAAGLGAFVYDHRNFGDSGGEPRQEVDPWRQINDLRDAITFAETLPQANPQAIGVWGSSFGGGHAIVIGATDRRVKCVVAQVPFTSGRSTVQRSIRPDVFAHIVLPGQAADRRARFAGQPPMMVPVVAEDPMVPAALSCIGAWEATQVMTAKAPNFRNEVTMRSLELAGAYEPGIYMPMIAPTPFLMIAANADYSTPTDGQLAAFQTALEPKRLKIVKGGHFDPYLEQFSEASTAARDWFVEHLR